MVLRNSVTLHACAHLNNHVKKNVNDFCQQNCIETKLCHSTYDQCDFLNVELIYHSRNGSIIKLHSEW